MVTHRHVTEYMAPLVESLEEIGYVDGETLFGAPYDFRYGLAAEGHPSKIGTKFLQDLKELIEKASSVNGGKPVVILSHSLGGPFCAATSQQKPTILAKKIYQTLCSTICAMGWCYRSNAYFCFWEYTGSAIG